MGTARSSAPGAGAVGQAASEGAPAQPWEVRAPGTYLLLICLDAAVRLDVGRLGSIAFPAGWYVYVGSALGGLGARLRRHVRRAKRHHWHVDAVRAAGTLTAIAIRPGRDRLECTTAATIAALPGGTRPVPRFGSSDCRCRSHLVHFAAEPRLDLGPGWLVVPVAERRAAGGPA
jgi:sugar fermentation stimulation protein A